MNGGRYYDNRDFCRLEYKDAMQDEDYELCRCIVLELGNLFTQVAAVEMVQAGNGLEAVAAALVLLINEDNRQLLNNENPLYLLIKLVLRDWSHENRIIQPIADSIRKKRPFVEKRE